MYGTHPPRDATLSPSGVTSSADTRPSGRGKGEGHPRRSQPQLAQGTLVPYAQPTTFSHRIPYTALTPLATPPSPRPGSRLQPTLALRGEGRVRGITVNRQPRLATKTIEPRARPTTFSHRIPCTALIPLARSPLSPPGVTSSAHARPSGRGKGEGHPRRSAAAVPAGATVRRSAPIHWSIIKPATDPL